MAKVTPLNDIASLANTASAKDALNQNFQRIEEAFENTLSRDGSLPNQMEADLDMNSNDILNANIVDAAAFHINGVPFEQEVAYSSKLYDIFSGTGVQVNFPLQIDPASLGNLEVSVAGAIKRPGIDYVYSGTTLTFLGTPPPAALNNILVRYDVGLPVGVDSADNILYTPPSTGLAGSIRQFLDSLWEASNTAGMALIRFLQAGVGATARTGQDKMREWVSIMDYAGVDPTGVGDSTTGIVAALTYAKSVGKSVFAPSGIYRTTAPITIPGGTQLVGEGWQPYTAYGTVATLGKGTVFHINHTGIGFLVQKDGVNRTSGVRIAQLAMYWNHAAPGPGWVPTVYDWAIKVDRADDVTVEDVLMVNPYKGIQITGTIGEPAGRLNLSRVFGQPLFQGVEIDLSVDVSSLDRVHFWPFWSDNVNVLNWMKTNNATFLKSNRSDNTELTNLFGFGYPRGIHISSNASGTTLRMRGQGIDFDDSKRALWIDSSADGSSGSFTNFNATANPATAGADLFVGEGDGVDWMFNNLRLSNSQSSTVMVTGNNGQYRFANVWADQWNIALGGNPAFSIGANCRADVVNGKFTQSNGAAVSGGPGIFCSDEWITYTPTLASGTGTITLGAVPIARYRRRGPSIELRLEVTITTNGTAGTSIIVGLPVIASQPAVLYGRERGATGKGLSGQILSGGSTTVITLSPDNGYPGGSGTILDVNGSYEVT